MHACAMFCVEESLFPFRNKFEQTLEALSQYETHEAQTLMTEALEAMDMMNNAIVLQNEVCTTTCQGHSCIDISTCISGFTTHAKLKGLA